MTRLTMQCTIELRTRFEEKALLLGMTKAQYLAYLLAHAPIVHGGSLPGGKSKTACECDE